MIFCKHSSNCDLNETLRMNSWISECCPNTFLLTVYKMALVAALLFLLPVAWACAPQKAGIYQIIKVFLSKWANLQLQLDMHCCWWWVVVFFFLDYVMISCFPNAIIANVPECPYGWEIGQLSLGGVCYTGVNTPGFYRFTIPDLTPKNLSYCATLSEVKCSNSSAIIS